YGMIGTETDISTTICLACLILSPGDPHEATVAQVTVDKVPGQLNEDHDGDEDYRHHSSAGCHEIRESARLDGTRESVWAYSTSGAPVSVPFVRFIDRCPGAWFSISQRDCSRVRRRAIHR